MNSHTDIISKLRQDLLKWEGYKPPLSGQRDLLGLGPLESVFPNGVFPKSSVHELVCASSEQAAASGVSVSGSAGTGVCSLLPCHHLALNRTR
jgi:protein ImuA